MKLVLSTCSDFDEQEELERAEEELFGSISNSSDIYKPDIREYDSESDSNVIRSNNFSLRNRTVEAPANISIDACSTNIQRKKRSRGEFY